jgi:hypothetical protein
MKSIVSEVKTDITQIQNDIVQVQNDVSQVVVSSAKQLLSMDFWSAPQEKVRINAAGITVSLPQVTVEGLPSGATVLRAIAMLKFRMVENTNAAANNLDGGTVADTSQVIQARDDSPGVWVDAVPFIDGQFGLEGEVREGGDVCIGSINIAGIVVGNDGYEFQWLLGKAVSDFLDFDDVQAGIRVWYSA